MLESQFSQGQSWGGLLAFLHLSSDGRGADDQPVSFTLSNTPTSVPLVEAEAGRLVEACGSVESFMAKHNLRAPPDADPPETIAAAYAHAGNTWRGTTAIEGLEASTEAMARVPCPSLVIRGEHDFCTAACVAGWAQLPDVRFETLAGASHHALIEAPERYLQALSAFLKESEDR